MIKFDMVEMTPGRALEWLERHNYNNPRPINRNRVKVYAEVMRKGGWKISAEPLQIAHSGRMLNGQHRLSAVVESGVTVTFAVARNVPEENASAIDRGLSRSRAHAIARNKKVVELAVLVVNLCGNPWSPSAQFATDEEVERVCDELEGAHELLLSEGTSKATAVFASTPYRLAAVIRILLGDEEYALQTYRALIVGPYSDLSPTAEALHRRITRELSSGSGLVHGLSAKLRQTRLAWQAFSPKRQHLTKIYAERAGDHDVIKADIIKALGFDPGVNI